MADSFSKSENIEFEIDGMWLKKPEIIKQFIDRRSDSKKLLTVNSQYLE
jgi:hypothetical protein